MTCAFCTSGTAIAACSTCSRNACETCAPFIPGPNRRKCPGGCKGYLAMIRARATTTPTPHVHAHVGKPARPAPSPARAPEPTFADTLLTLGVSGALYDVVQRYALAEAAERAVREGGGE